MRTIQKRPAPNALTAWRTPRLAANKPEGMECNYGEMRRDAKALAAVEESLWAEQGGLCAYTGHRIRLMSDGELRNADFHLEHLTPQTYCKSEFDSYGKDTDYSNLVACWPRPNVEFEPKYGARRKGNWPSPTEESQFVSPLRMDCLARFSFTRLGKISAANPNDDAAKETIKKLGLDHGTLTELRREAILGALNPASRQITLSQARSLLAQMQQTSNSLSQGQRVQLRAFCFAIQPALEREIRKLEAIQNQKRS